MPITSSAKRALRVTARRRVHNLRRTRVMQDTVKTAIDLSKKGKDAKSSEEALRLAHQAIDKAAKRGVIKKNTAARKKSQIAKLLASKGDKTSAKTSKK